MLIYGFINFGVCWRCCDCLINCCYLLYGVGIFRWLGVSYGWDRLVLYIVKIKINFDLMISWFLYWLIVSCGCLFFNDVCCVLRGLLFIGCWGFCYVIYNVVVVVFIKVWLWEGMVDVEGFVGEGGLEFVVIVKFFLRGEFFWVVVWWCLLWWFVVILEGEVVGMVFYLWWLVILYWKNG